jgi:hypothetical protein
MPPQHEAKEVLRPSEDLQFMTEFAQHHPLDAAQFVRDCTTQYPEMAMLTGANQLATPGQIAQTDGSSVGAQLFPDIAERELREFNRTAVGLLTLEWALEGDYDAFTACQQGRPDKLSRDSFDALKAYTDGILVDDDAKEAMRVSLVINDLGKVDSVIAQIAEATGTQEVDHDKILLEALERFPETSPSFNRLTPHYKEVVLEGLRAQFNLGQFMQGENVAASLAGLQGLSKEALDFYNLHVFYDIAGAAGHVRQDGSVTINEPTYQNFSMAVTALEGVNDASLAETYDAYLRQKADQLGIPDIDDPTNRAVTRLSCMLRYSSPEQAANVANVFNRLPQGTRAILEHELSKTGVDDGYATLIYYAPAIVNNLQRAYGEQVAAGQMTSQEAFESALFTGCTTLSQLYMQSRIHLTGQEGNGVFTVLAADVATTAATDPSRLQQDPVAVERIEGSDNATAKVEPVSKIETADFDPLQLEQLEGKRVVVMGMGGGSDVVQATVLAKLLEKAGKECAGVISVRGSARGVTNHGGQIAEGVYQTTPQTTLDTRYFEDLPPADGYKTVLVFNDRDRYDIEQQVQAAVGAFEADTVIAIDTGGDALYYNEAAEGTNPTVASPDQDLRVLAALRGVNGVRQYTAIFGAGIDAPPYAQTVLQDAHARLYSPSDADQRTMLDQYAAWGLPSGDPKRFAKTLPVVHAALRGVRGLFESPIPSERILDASNPWNPYSHIQDAASRVFVMDAEAHRRAIRI